MADEPGFEIAGEFFKFPVTYRICDPVLVAEITGLEWEEFAEGLDNKNPRILPGLLAVGVWQKYPRWKRDKVVNYVQSVEFDALSFPDVTTPEDDAGPPDLAATTASAAESSMPVSGESEASDANPEVTGLQLSEITAA